MSPLTEPTKLTLAKSFTQQAYMWEFPQQHGLWYPGLISTALWLDAADSSTIQQSGGVVSEWRDKSGNGRNASQSDSLLQPTVVSNAFNNKQSIVFSGSSNSRLVGGANGLSTAASIFAAVQDTGSTSTLAGIFTSGSDAEGAGFGIFRTAGNIVVADGFGSGSTNSANSTSTINQPSLIAATYTQANTSGTSIFFNGVLEENFTGTGVNVTPAAGFQVGGRTQGNIPARVFKGNISEIIALGVTASTDTRQRIEGYLAHKWGLTANLPSGHPYKTVGPTP